MYKQARQLSISDFIFPYGTLSEDNRWVCLAKIIDWDRVDDEYATHFVNNGAPAHPSRMALGALIAKQMLKCSDAELCAQVAENPYLQHFLGLKEFKEECPFGASTMVAFRMRFSEEDIARINDWVIDGQGATVDGNESCDVDDADDSDGDGDGTGGAAVCLDATVAPSNIRYPTDTSLLNEAREKLESIIDDLHAQVGGKKPRTYRRRARKDYLNWSKSKKKTAKATRKARAKQLGYVRRDLGHVDLLLGAGGVLCAKDSVLLDTICVLHAQQHYMHTERVTSVANRIVSIEQPWVRPMVRGKTARKVEFGAKVHVMTEDGFARIVSLSFDACNEADELIDALEEFRKRTGAYPKRALVDKIYRNRKNLAWCKERAIAVSGPRLGRPPKDQRLTREQKKQEYEDICARNVVEGVFGTTKTAYGMDPVMTRLEETTRTVIALSILAFNLKKLLKASLCSFSEAVSWVLHRLFSCKVVTQRRVLLIAT